MAATPLLGLELPVTGTLSGTWGDTVNNSITSLLDTAVAGTTTLSTDADVTLTATASVANQARSAILLCTGARTALRTITAPAQSKVYVIQNLTTGGFSVKLVGVGPTTGITILNGEEALVAWNGSDFVRVSTLGGPITGSTGTFTGDVQATSYNGGQLAGLRNKIINGDMRVAQRGTTFSLTATGAYTVDRWIAVTSVAPSGTLTLNVTPVAITEGTSSSSAIRLSKTTGTFAGTLVAAQAFETSNSWGLAGETVTISFKARKGASYTGNALPYLVVTTGTGIDQSANNMLAGTWTGYAVSTTTLTGTLTTSMSSFSATTTIPASATQVGVLVGLTYATATTGSANDYLDITDVQLEVGPVATPFEQRPIGVELALCQRYFQSLLVGGYGTNNAATVISRVTWPLFVAMRAQPTIAVLSGTPSFFQGANTANHSSIGSTYVTTTTAQADINVTGGSSTAGLASIQKAENGVYSASAEL